MDLSKAFDSINHNFLVSKLKAYGFSGIALQFIKSYLKNRKQKVNLNNTFSEWKTILNDVLQGSILGNLLLTIFLNHFFLLACHSYLRNYADDNTLYCFDDNINDANDKLRIDLVQVMEWPNEKYMVLNTDKCHHICSGRDTENSRFCFAGNVYANRKEENILSIIINSAVLYDSHIKEV